MKVEEGLAPLRFGGEELSIVIIALLTGEFYYQLLMFMCYFT